MTDEERNPDDETDEGQDAQGTDSGDAEAGPPEDIENDPAYSPEDENLKGIKGG
jgi:hypothetical protein